MDQMENYVIDLLETYCDRERKINILHYNMEHPAKVGGIEQIESMNYGRNDSAGHTKGHISNKTLYIALNYEEQAAKANAEMLSEIADELFELVWGDRIFEKCGIRRDEGGDGGKTLEIRGKRRLSARDGGANYQQS